MTDNKNLTLEAFKFSTNDISFKLLHEMKLADKFKASVNYALNNCPIQKLRKDLSKLKWDKGKSYSWVVIGVENISLIIRKYRTHFTFYVKHKTKITDNEIIDEYFNTKYACFTVHSNEKLMDDSTSDSYIDNNFIDLNTHINDIISMIKDGQLGMLWNNAALPRPKHLEIKIVWGGYDDLNKIDDFCFACEELFEKHLEIFAQTTVYEKVKTIKVGDNLGGYVVTGVHTDLQETTYLMPYFHGVGLYLQNPKFPDSEPTWADVYSLSLYYYECLFPENNLVDTK